MRRVPDVAIEADPDHKRRRRGQGGGGGGGHNLNRQKRRQTRVQLEGSETVMANPFRPRVALGPSEIGGVEMFFDDIEDALVEKIEAWGRNHIVVGCVAWLSSPRVLAALARCRRVLLLVNDEAYGRWGGGKCLAQYAQLPGLGGAEATPADLFGHFPNILGQLRTEGYQAVRAVGRGTRSLMHAKYIVFFADFAEGELPAAVWTGSMNHTRQASSNVENAVFVDSPRGALAYFHDFANSFYASHPLRN